MRAFLSGLIMVLLLTGMSGAAAETAAGSAVPTYRDAVEKTQRLRTIPAWLNYRSMILGAMQEIMGPLPGSEKRCPLNIKIEEQVDCGDYIRRFVTYESEPGCRVPAYVLIPKAVLEPGASPARGVLCLHPTNTVIGHKVVVGLGNDPGRAYALELTRRGFVTIAPAYPLMADYQPALSELGYVSGTMKAIWDNIRAIDLLETLPFVRRGGVAAIGHSLGGHNAIYTAAFEPRIKVIVSSCGFDSYLDYYSGDPGVWQTGRGWTQERYMPRLAEYRGRLHDLPFDFHEVIASLAPRPIFINAPVKDTNFQWRSVDRVVAAASGIYELYGEGKRVIVEHPDTIHEFPEGVRGRAYQFIEERLQ